MRVGEMFARGYSGSRSTCSEIIVEPRWRDGTWVCARRHGGQAIDEDPVHDRAVVIGEVTRVANALARIDDEPRALLLLVPSTDFNIEQAAESLHISPAATRTRLWRARQQLRAELGASNEHTDESSSARDVRAEVSQEEQ